MRGLPARLRRPQTTVRWRLTLLYGGLFLACGAGLLAITYGLVTKAEGVPGPVNFAFAGRGEQPKANRGSGAVAVRSPPPKALPRDVRQLPADARQLLLSPAGGAVVRVVGNGQRIADIHQLEVESAIALGIMAIVSGLLGWVVAGRVLRPLRTITVTAQHISEANLHQRLALPGPRDELRRLADTIDGLLERLEGAFDAQRQFVANASHELRTPLTAARAMLEMVMSDPRASVEEFRATCRQVLNENEYQEQLIEALLALAHGQRGLDHRELIDLEAIVGDELQGNRADAAARGLRLEVSLEPAFASGDPRLIQRLVSNLLDNAIRHNVEEGLVRVAVSARGSESLLEIENTGAALPCEEIDRLLQPFQRMGPDRTGHRDGLGLGLSIVAAIADAHDATLLVHARPEGGLAVELLFPCAAPEQEDRGRESETPLPTPAVDGVRT
jgi:signal transduction histidine kinase